MPGINDQSPTTLNPGLLSAQNLVSANAPATMNAGAVQAMTDAMQKGQLTAADIIDRLGELGKTHRKAQVLHLKQQISDLQDPGLIAARHAVELAHGKQATLAGAQADAGMPLVQPQADLAAKELAARSGLVQPQTDVAAQQLDAQLNTAKYPSAALFDKLAPGMGIEAPLTPEGNPDWPKKAKIGAQIALHQAEQAEAKSKLENITTHVSADGTILTAVTKQGQPVSPEEVAALQRKANQPFQLLTPGSASVVPASVAPIAPEPTPQQRAAVANQTGADPYAVSRMSAADIQSRLAPVPAARPVVAPAGTPATPAAGSVLPGVGMSLGPKAPGAPGEKAPTEAQQRAQLALARFAQSNDMMGSLREAGYDPTTTLSWMGNMLPEVLKTGDRKMYNAAVNAWSQGLLRLESGAAISKQEASWYDKAFFPQVGDPPAVTAQKDALRKDAEKMVAEIAQAGKVESPQSVAQTKRLYAQADALAKASPTAGAPKPGPVITLGNGQRVQRGADGQYYPAP